MVARKQVEEKPVRRENPLMPDERLRQMYAAMVQMRMLEELLGAAMRTRKGAVRRATTRGEEAARASTALSLEAGDLISDGSDSAGMDLLLGRPLRELKRGLGKEAPPASAVDGFARKLRPMEDAGEQLRMALGVAEALKVQGSGRVLLVYVAAGAAGMRRWEKTLGVAGRRELPVIFVVLPGSHGGRPGGQGELSRRSRRWGVPGFPVDGSDAIALYRVMQESLLRGRADGGPALLECVAFQLAGDTRRWKPEDPIERLGGLLLRKGVASEAWMRRTRSAVSQRLGGAGR